MSISNSVQGHIAAEMGLQLTLTEWGATKKSGGVLHHETFERKTTGI
jgi:hypothetical protein